MSSDKTLSRRRFLGATGAAASGAALAGCSGGGGQSTSTPEGTQGNSGGTTTAGGTTAEPTTTEVYKPNSLAVKAKDDHTLEITLAKPFHAALQMLAYSSFAAVPEGIVGDVEGYDGKMSYQEFSTKQPIGSGPFQLKNWTQGTEASVTKYGDYYGDAPSLDGVHWQVIEKDAAQYNYSMNKNADLFTIPTTKYSQDKLHVDHTDSQGRQIGTYGPARNGATLSFTGIPTINTFYVGFNMAEVPKPVRQAFAYAMNQQAMVDQVFKGRGQPAYFLTPPTIYPGGADAYTKEAKNNYPYGYNESQLGKAKQVMQQAGYGPNNKFTLQWTQYTSDTWLSMAKNLRDMLSSAFIDMQIQQADFSTLLKRGRNGNLQAYTLGWIADWPAPDNFLQLLNPPQTQTSLDAPISYINWNGQDGDAAQKATDGYKQITNNEAPTDKAQQARNKAYVDIEHANWEDVGFLNVYHRMDEYFWYDTIDYSAAGGMGISRQKYNHTKTTDNASNNELRRILTGTITTFDPIAATDTASGEVIQQMFDPLTNYPSGQTSVKNLTATDYNIGSDLKTYTFKLDPNATFHDGSKVTASDFVYAFERLAASKNSRRSGFILDTLNVKHDTHTVTTTPQK